MAMTSEIQALETDRRKAAYARTSGGARLLHDIKADWRRWTGIERATATTVAVLSAVIPLYLALVLSRMH
jgi:hypothetical protein